MIFKSNNQLFGYGFYLWIYLLCNINLLYGTITISAQVTGDRVVAGYINSSNTLTISGTFVNTDGGAQDLNTYRNGNYEIKILIKEKFVTERGRINCSLQEHSGKWRWLGIQYVIAEY